MIPLTFATIMPDSGANHPSVVRIVREGAGFTLSRDGRPYFIKGAVSGMYPERLVAAGGNSIRGGVRDLDRAHALGLTVLANLPFGKQRWGFDYGDRASVEKQLAEIEAIVTQHRDHPALLMWALGNELEIQTTAEQRIPLWWAIDEAAALIHRLDPNHPVITVMGCDFIFQSILPELDRLCPNLDAIGLNAYNDMLRLPEAVAEQGWKRPYLITEFGPRGHWQVPKTSWDVPIEDSSTEKAGFYQKAYEHSVAGRPQCLGAYVFHWAWHHEKTHTWYGMCLQDGSPTAAVDTMQYLWTGKWPANRCPRIGRHCITIIAVPLTPNAQCPTPESIFPPGTNLRCTVDADDPDGDPITVTWDLRPDVSDNPNVGGDHEEPVKPIEGAIVSSTGREARVRIPAAAGKYRLFVYVHDANGSAATANVPILAR